MPHSKLELMAVILVPFISWIFDAHATTYTYDEAGRLVSAIYDDGSQIVYEYDDAGNRTQVERDPLGVSTPVKDG